MPAGIPRTVLVVLLLNANQVVSSEQLALAVWGERRPSSAAAGLRNHVLRLRRQLGARAGARVRTVVPGYLIEVGPAELDMDLFVEGCRAGRRQLLSGEVAQARECLAGALELWRGEPLADLPPQVDVAALVQQLHETRLAAWLDRIEADLAQGRHQELVAELQGMARAHPLHEAVHRQLMLALYRGGRQAEALEAYRALRGTLVGELGVEPSEPVRDLHQRILAADPALASPGPGVRSAQEDRSKALGGAGGDLLPSGTRVFTGRGEELERLLALARGTSHAHSAPTVVISAIEGMAGIGKSALAVHAAHRLADAFPDGRLFLDLQGHTPGLEPLTAGEALARLLDALQVAPQAVPRDLGQRAASYRGRLAGTRTLIVLDNAAGTAQIRPLLPSAPGCMVIVTSRRSLAGLEDTHAIALGALPADEAGALLHRAAGPGRIAAGDRAVAELVALCGHMPLAIGIVAARLRNRRALRIETVLEQLGEEHLRLDRLSDQERSLGAAFTSSYLALPEAEQRLFRLLGLVPGVDFDAYAAAALAGTGHRAAEHLLESLLDHHLIVAHTVGRYRFHDLVRIFAREMAAKQGPGRAREHAAAVERLLDCYLHTAQAAHPHLTRRTRSVGKRPAFAGDAAGDAVGARPAVPMPNRAAAMARMRAERDNLLSAYDSLDPACGRAVDLAAALAAFLLSEGPWERAAPLHEAAAAAARGRGDLESEADALCDLARIRMVTGELADATALLERSLTLYAAAGTAAGVGVANAWCDLGRVRHLTGDFPAARAALERSRQLCQDLGDRLGEANALCELARGVDSMTGDHATALERLKRVLALYQDLGNEFGQSIALSELGRIHYLTADLPAAADVLRRALAAFESLGSRNGQASTLGVLGRVQLRTADVAGAATRFEQALAIFRDLGHRHGQANALWGIGLVGLDIGDLAGATARFQDALALFEGQGSRHGQASIWHELGRVRHAQKDEQAASDLLERALAVFEDLGDHDSRAQVLISIGALALQTSGAAAAGARYRQAVDLAERIGNPLHQAMALEGAARCSWDLGRYDSALADLEQAVELYRRTGAGRLGPATALLTSLRR